MTLPPPYELRLNERPGDRRQFDLEVGAILAKSRPGGIYRIPFLAGRWKRRAYHEQWERIVRIHMGRAYEIGRGQ